MTIRRDVRRPDRSIETRWSNQDGGDWKNSILEFCDGISNFFGTLIGVGIFLILSVIFCWAIIGLPRLVAALAMLFAYLLIALWPTSILFWVVFPFAMILTYFGFWLSSAYEERDNDGFQRGRRVMTAADARRAAHRQLDAGNLPPSRMRRRN